MGPFVTSLQVVTDGEERVFTRLTLSEPCGSPGLRRAGLRRFEPWPIPTNFYPFRFPCTGPLETGGIKENASQLMKKKLLITQKWAANFTLVAGGREFCRTNSLFRVEVQVVDRWTKGLLRHETSFKLRGS